MAFAPPLFTLLALAASTAMALSAPRAYVRAIGVEEERISLAYNGDVYETSECLNNKKSCRETGKCVLDNSAYVCCCDYCSRRSLNKSTNFCGEDGVTYTSLCEYRRQQCLQNRHIGIAYKGQCNQTCAQKRNDTLFKQAIGEIPRGYVPVCDEDNRNLYRVRQCSKVDGLKCWCVLPESNNNITQQTSVEHEGDLNCEQELKIATLTCDPCMIVREVFKAIPGATNYESYIARKIDESQRFARTEQRDDLGVSSKLFDMFDRSGDGLLSVGDIDVISRWLFLPRTCLLDTLSICDDDQDNSISTGEWCTCIMNRFKCPELGTPRDVNCSPY